MRNEGRPYYPDPGPGSRLVVLVLVVILFWILYAGPASGAVDQADRWQRAELRTADLMRLDKCITLFKRTQARYDRIERMRENGAPAAILFCLHYRESDNDFHAHAHNGDPLTHRTRQVPAGRLPKVPPPYTFEQSAEDAYYVCDKLQLTIWSSVQSAFDRTEMFNGFGYRDKGIAAPYNWSGTNLYRRGKYIADHRYSRTAIDQQLGCAAILMRMRDRGIKLPWQ